ncbi:hypothetical protein CRUP_029461 [Coryphaenoides rupestris]|nr:hypothetical protein CRUP_029461 [Coryphaenoides rupestris]
MGSGDALPKVLEKFTSRLVQNRVMGHKDLQSLTGIVAWALAMLFQSVTEDLLWQVVRRDHVLEKFTSRLVQNRVMGHKDLQSLTKYQLILAREQFRKNPPPHIMGPQQGVMEGDFALSISLCHGYELLMQMGLRSLFLFTQGIMDGSKDPEQPFIYSHPKLQKLEEVVVQHFRLWVEDSSNKTGEAAAEIAGMLNRHAPLIRVMTFMGQASAGKGVKGFTQKEQLEVVRRFRQGGFNTLVSTCVGEEGLDIGEVDLIVCFDAQKSPIRLVQRMGRTGRKRQGRIVVILAEGREERTYNQSQSNKRSVYKSIVGDQNRFHMYPSSPRMLPPGVSPALHKMHITTGQFHHGDSSGGGSRRSSGGRRSGSKVHASLIHPQNLEYSLWASTMRLAEDEAPPTLRRSHFLSLPHEHTPIVSGPALTGARLYLTLMEWVVVAPGGSMRGLLGYMWKRFWSPTMDLYTLRLLLWLWLYVCRGETASIMRSSRGLGRHGSDIDDHDAALPLAPSAAHALHQADGALLGVEAHDEVHLADVTRRFAIRDEECSYEKELLPHLHKADVVAGLLVDGGADKPAKRPTKKKTTKTGKSKSASRASSEAERTAEESERDSRGGVRSCLPSATTRLMSPAANDPDFVDFNGEEMKESRDPGTTRETSGDAEPEDGIGSENCPSPLEGPVGDPLPTAGDCDNDPGLEEDIEIQAMFYLPKGVPAGSSSHKRLPELHPSESLRVILANVAELLSRSPPQLPFDFDMEEDMLDAGSPDTPNATSLPPSPERMEPADSASWDDVFRDETDHKVRDEVILINDQPAEDEELRTAKGAVRRIEGDVKRGNGSGRKTPARSVDVDVDQQQGGDSVAAQCRAALWLDQSMDLFGEDEAEQIRTPEEEDVSAATDAVLPGQHTPTAADGTEPRTSPAATTTTHSPRHTHAVRNVHPPRTTLETSRRVSHITAAPSDHGTDAFNSNFRLGGIDSTSSTEERLKSDSFDSSCDLYAVNFDLGYSLDDSEEEEEEGMAPVSVVTASSSPPWKEQQQHLGGASVTVPATTIPDSSTPLRGLPRPGERRLSTPLSRSLQRVAGDTGRFLLASPLTSKGGGALPSPITSGLLRRTLLPGPSSGLPGGLKRKQEEEEESLGSEAKRSNTSWARTLSKEDRMGPGSLSSPPAHPGVSDSEEEESDDIAGGGVSDDDFQNDSTFSSKPRPSGAARPSQQQAKAQKPKRRGGRHFLDEEAELSGEEGLSSDEEDGEDLNRSLEGFVVDNSHVSQGMNG